MALATKTGEVKFVRKGRPGAMPYPCGRHDPATVYTCTETLAPFVEQDGQYYVMSKVGTWCSNNQGRTPREDYARYGNNAMWIYMEKVKALFLEILFADFAKLGSAIFYEDYCFSQYGEDSNGNSTNAYHNFNPYNLNVFKPNILIDWYNGKLTALDAAIRGHIEAKSGSIENCTIDSLRSVFKEAPWDDRCVGDNYFLKTNLYTNLDDSSQSVGRLLRVINDSSDPAYVVSSKPIYYEGARLNYATYVDKKGFSIVNGYVELLGVGKNGVLNSWLIVNKKYFNPSTAYGYYPRVIAEGSLTYNSRGFAYTYRTFDRTSLTLHRYGVGQYGIEIPSSWNINNGYGYNPIVTPLAGSDGQPVTACVVEQHVSILRVNVYKGTALYNGGFSFMLVGCGSPINNSFNSEGWYSQNI